MAREGLPGSPAERGEPARPGVAAPGLSCPRVRAGGSGGALGGRWERPAASSARCRSSPVRVCPPRGSAGGSSPRRRGCLRGELGCTAVSLGRVPPRCRRPVPPGVQRAREWAAAAGSRCGSTGSRGGRRRRERFVSFSPLRTGARSRGKGRARSEGKNVRDADLPLPLLVPSEKGVWAEPEYLSPSRSRSCASNVGCGVGQVFAERLKRG